ncbi:GNAT family N-acetyltransferase [Anaerosporobacter faecicola]|uniref:GNAT family N-acetyltransferase n=1 Tax=Anaerosporobacter faecicola TaxID=2718714 RepID=UPI00143A2335|nr:GNAT family N-acetyltransferase [Anaerosporobacter faecicola]
MNLQYEIKNFLDAQGRLTQFPAKKKTQKMALLYLASKISNNKVYTEKEMNELIDQWHTYSDACTLRRELYNNCFLSRSKDGSHYTKEEKQPSPKDLGLDDSFDPFDVFNGFKLLLPEYRLIRLTNRQKEDIHALHTSNPYYFSQIQDHPITMEESLSDLTAVPNGFPIKQKFYFGIYEGTNLIALMDYLVGYDYEHSNMLDCVWIGFFMIHGDYKRKGIGSYLMRVFERASKENQIKKIQLACIDGNEESLPFWEHLGFHRIKCSQTTLSNHQTRDALVLEKIL